MQSRGCRQLGRIEETKSACFGKVTSLNTFSVILSVQSNSQTTIEEKLALLLDHRGECKLSCI